MFLRWYESTKTPESTQIPETTKISVSTCLLNTLPSVTSHFDATTQAIPWLIQSLEWIMWYASGVLIEQEPLAFGVSFTLTSAIRWLIQVWQYLCLSNESIIYTITIFESEDEHHSVQASNHECTETHDESLVHANKCTRVLSHTMHALRDLTHTTQWFE